MSYNFVWKKLKANGVVILDGGNGGELESSGAKMDKDLWAGKCAIDDPDKMLQVHEKYINAGADIITSNTYAITPISMKEYGYDQFTKAWNEESVKLALKAANHSKREIAVAGSVSTSGSWDKLSEEDIKPGFNEHLKILKEAGVDLIILEAMTSRDRTVENIIECHHITGSGDFILKVVAKDIESYQELMLDKVTEIEVTDSLQSIVILSTFKESKVMPL